MGRYRKIDTRIHNDAKFTALSDDGKLLFFTLLTHPNMTSLGAMRCAVPGLASEMGWAMRRLANAVAEVALQGMVEHCEKASYIGLPNFLKYNPPSSANVVKSWANVLDLIPECDAKERLAKRAAFLLKDLPASYRKALPEGLREALPNDLPEGLSQALPEALLKDLPKGSGKVIRKGIRTQEQEQEQELEQEGSPPMIPPSPGGMANGREPDDPPKLRLARKLFLDRSPDKGLSWSWARENGALLKLVERSEHEADPDDWLRRYIDAAWRLREGGLGPWRSQPWTPHTMCGGLMPRVVEEMDRAPPPGSSLTADVRKRISDAAGRYGNS